MARGPHLQHAQALTRTEPARITRNSEGARIDTARTKTDTHRHEPHRNATRHAPTRTDTNTHRQTRTRHTNPNKTWALAGSSTSQNQGHRLAPDLWVWLAPGWPQPQGPRLAPAPSSHCINATCYNASILRHVVSLQVRRIRKGMIAQLYK